MVCHAYTGPQQTRMLAVLYELLPLPPFRCTVSPYGHVLADFLCSIFQLKGLDQLLRHFPDILHSTFAQGTERRVVDRLNQCLSPLLRGHPHRPSRGWWMQDAGYFRTVFLLGTALLGVGIFAISVCSEYWHFLLAQGLCLGIGHGCLFCPTLAVLSTYLLRRRALALGIAACGMSRVSQYASHPQQCCTKLPSGSNRGNQRFRRPGALGVVN